MIFIDELDALGKARGRCLTHVPCVRGGKGGVLRGNAGATAWDATHPLLHLVSVVSRVWCVLMCVRLYVRRSVCVHMGVCGRGVAGVSRTPSRRDE
jgi:hypothetical protein